ncbi:MAG: response regulator [Chloroflexi bacterium]|nr:response regulator [Chloroflexota bacterium]MCI0790267.1 response regulator [Chloroflexota bacterium]MCI0795393.1 response regulator [Chloroflexota bacterium]MCI0840410.1 response regulator [Chloroflexota bacterium]MCI0868245.1 response regulator [Chloroflexota bacterium]
MAIGKSEYNLGQDLIKVLLVDDDEDDYMITRDLLLDVEALEYDLDWISSYAEALDAIERNQHDIYLIDYRLGERDGMQLLNEALDGGCTAPIILLTGQGDREVDVEAMKAGAADYLVKGQIDHILLERSIRHSIERKALEREHAALEEQLLQAQKLESIGQLAGGIAHDFNNLMTPIIGYAQMGLTTLPEEYRERVYLEEILKAADRATNLIQQLLAFSRRQVVELQVIDLNSLLVNIDMMLQRLIGEDVELVILPSENLGAVKVDPTQIEQVVVNLAVNARDAMPEGGTLIVETSNIEFGEEELKNHPDMAAGPYVMFAVSDTGHGMSEEVKAHLFEPFYTTKEKGKGTGLGLSTCYGIIAQNKGYIWVYSEIGSGTTFKIYLPSSDVIPQGTERPSGTKSNELPRGSETVLLVEDEEQVRELAARVLRQQGYTVLQASNGVEALSIASRHADGEIDLLLTDVVMPLIGGRELSIKLRDIHPNVRVIYTSGYTDEAVIRHGMLKPGTDFVQKPYSLAGLTQKIRSVLDEPREVPATTS